MDFYPELRKAWEMRQRPFYQQMFQLVRNHLYCRSMSRSSDRIELRSSYRVVQLEGSFKQLGTLWKIVVAGN